MMPLQGHRVVAWGGMADRPLARLLSSLGAEVVTAPLAVEALDGASFLLDDLGLARLEDAGIRRDAIEARHPRLVHVSVTPFGSIGPRARWRGGELVASAMGGVLRLTGEPDRPPVKEALDACLFHADMVAAAVSARMSIRRCVSRSGTRRPAPRRRAAPCRAAPRATRHSRSPTPGRARS